MYSIGIDLSGRPLLAKFGEMPVLPHLEYGGRFLSVWVVSDILSNMNLLCVSLKRVLVFKMHSELF